MNGMNGSGSSSGKSTSFSRGKMPSGNVLPPSRRPLNGQSPFLNSRLSYSQDLSPGPYPKVRSTPQNGSLPKESPPPNGPWQKRCCRTPSGQGTKPLPDELFPNRNSQSSRLNRRPLRSQDLSPDPFPKIRSTPQNELQPNGKSEPMSK